LFRPKALIAIEPLHGLLHGCGRELACDGTSGFAARDQAGIHEDIEMLHDGGQRHCEWLRQFADRNAIFLVQPRQQRAPRRIGEGTERAIKGVLGGILKLNHEVKYWAARSESQVQGEEKFASMPRAPMPVI
jgi:hypothetical protein